jgi:hypothetical protein
MELSESQIEKFKKFHQRLVDLDIYSESEIREIARGVARFYLTLYKIHRRIEKEQHEPPGSNHSSA